jgi:hypothetical protein
MHVMKTKSHQPPAQYKIFYIFSPNPSSHHTHHAALNKETRNKVQALSLVIAQSPAIASLLPS